MGDGDNFYETARDAVITKAFCCPNFGNYMHGALYPCVQAKLSLIIAKSFSKKLIMHVSHITAM